MKTLWRWLMNRCLICGGHLEFIGEYVLGRENLQEYKCTECGRFG